MDDPYKIAMAQREKLETKVSKLEQRLSVARSELSRAEQFISSWEHYSGIVGQRPSDTAAESTVTGANPAKEAVARMAVEAVLEAGRPLTRAEVYVELQKKGLTLQGKVPIVVLSTMLWRMKEVIPFIKGAGYWPVGHPLPAAYRDRVSDADTTPSQVDIFT